MDARTIPGRCRTAARRFAAAALAACTSCGRGGPPPAEEPAMKCDASREIASRLAGSWYTADPDALRAELQGYLDAVPAPALTNVCALLLPHAGYAYSGAVAAHGVRQVAGRPFRRVIVLGPTHRVPLANAAALPSAGTYRTSLGAVPLDTECIARLARRPGFRFAPAAEGGEHSVEIEFPLLQAALRDFRLVPIVLGQLDDDAVALVADGLRPELDAGTLLVASTDFTHYGANFDYVPFRTNIAENLEKLDLGAFEKIRAKDLAGFRAYVRETGATICGRDAVAVLLALLGPGHEVRLLKYDTSGRQTGEWGHCVSYVAAAVTGAWGEPAGGKAAAGADPLPLDAAERRELLRLARATIAHYLERGRAPSPADVAARVTPGLKQVAGAFVTLHAGGELRGCIGEIFPRRALWEAVMERAVDSAANDPRFPPVRAAELAAIDIEISALAPPRGIASWKDIVVGRHGIVLHKAGRSAVFLPQVATEQGWNVETTLDHLAMKAGLPRDAWREGARFEVFEAVVFGEKTPH